MTRVVLPLFDLLAPLLTALGVDYAQFRAILQAKLTLDSRRTMTAVQSRQGKKAGNTFVGGLVIYALMGLMVAFTPMGAGSALVSMTIVHAFLMTMISMSLVADFSTVLLDTTDNAIFQPRPVTGRTLLAARLAHIVVYLGSLALALSLGTFVTGTIRWGYGFSPLFAATLICSVSLIVCAVNLFYLAAIRFTTGERLRDFILYVQIVMSVALVAGYQIMPRLMDMTALKSLRIDGSRWIYLFPPTWMAGPVDLLAGQYGRPQWILSAMAFLVPLGGLYLVFHAMGDRFSSALAEIDTVRRSRSAGRGGSRQSAVQWLARTLCRGRTSQAAFELVWTLCSRDRQFKQRTYSSLAIILVFPAFWLISGSHDLRQALAELPSTKKYLLVLYMACAMLPSSLVNLRFSDQWQAAWIYTALPIARPGDVLVAALKALLVRFVAPVFVLISGATLAIWGPAILGDIALAACATFLMCTLQGVILGRVLPFSEAFGVKDASGRMGRNMILLLLPAGLGGIHYGLTFLPPAPLMACPVVLFMSWLLLRTYARTPWAQLD